jgi:hypothetical protein
VSALLDAICPDPVAAVDHEPVPHSADAERWLVGLVLKRPSLLKTLDVPPGLFTDGTLRAVWRTLLELDAAGPWDVATAIMALPRGTPEWAVVVDADWTSGYWQAADLAALLHRTHEARRLLAAAQELAEAAYAVDLDRCADVVAQMRPARPRVAGTVVYG